VTERDDMALLLVRLGDEDGGRVLPSRLLARPAASASRQAFLVAQANGWLDSEGWVTQPGLAALEESS
jgi:hypothetical protein